MTLFGAGDYPVRRGWITCLLSASSFVGMKSMFGVSCIEQQVSVSVENCRPAYIYSVCYVFWLLCSLTNISRYICYNKVDHCSLFVHVCILVRMRHNWSYGKMLWLILARLSSFAPERGIVLMHLTP